MCFFSRFFFLRLLAFSSLGLFCFTFRPSAAFGRLTVPQDSSANLNRKLERDILYYVNLDRKARGLVPVALNSIESAVASQHSRNMASGKTPFGHEGAQQRMVDIQKQIGPLTGFGENVAFGQSSGKEVVDEWLQSKVHRENIEGDFTLTGIGWAKDATGRTYYTEVFTK
jgi:uncharacterized protein YkwD